MASPWSGIGTAKDRKPFQPRSRRNKPANESPAVIAANHAGAVAAMEYLIGLGHRRFAVLGWPEASRVGQNRIEGITKGLADAGLDLAGRDVPVGPPDVILDRADPAERDQWSDLPANYHGGAAGADA